MARRGRPAQSRLSQRQTGKFSPARRRVGLLALVAAAAAAAVGALYGRALNFVRSPTASNSDSWRRRDLGTSAVQWFGLLSAAPLEAQAEETEVFAPAPDLKTVKSKIGKFTMDVPNSWNTDLDVTTERLIFSYDFYMRDFTEYMAARAERIPLGELLLGEQFLPSAEDLAADSWETVIQDPITKEDMGLWIMRHKTRKPGATMQGKGGKEVQEVKNEGPGAKEDTVVDATVLDGGSALVFHVRSTITNADNENKTRYWSNKAILKNGTISVAYVSALEKHWESSYAGPVNGQYLDRVAQSLKPAA